MSVSIAAPPAPEPATLTPRQAPHKARFLLQFPPISHQRLAQLRAGHLSGFRVIEGLSAQHLLQLSPTELQFPR